MAKENSWKEVLVIALIALAAIVAIRWLSNILLIALLIITGLLLLGNKKVTRWFNEMKRKLK